MSVVHTDAKLPRLSDKYKVQETEKAPVPILEKVKRAYKKKK